ncbi:bisanhydrobacterioruberin hydratase [Halorientalis salina]|uniref:bisanhydrobacterioruberin hydratase n=1 Tax=Halorientalis salina TaxID=2932266 RepID=UPI0010ABD03F|nr:bisanhydrobacterioruberin hydratase [Halorientalis salina]
MAVESVTRERVEARLDDLVQENRFLVAVVFPAMGAILLVASAESLLPGPLNFNPYLILFGTLVMRLPLVAGVAPLVDRRAMLAMIALTVYSYAIEYVGTTTGWPYGHFAYGIDLGPMLLGKVPLGLPVFFFPLVLNSYLLCLLLLGGRATRWLVRLPVVIAAVLAVDLVLDPGAVGLGFWAYDAGGAYYDVPWSNYAGWVLSATVAVGLFDVAFDRAALVTRVQSCPFMLDDLVSFVILWGSINAYFFNWIPVAVAGLFFLGLVQIDRFDFAVVRTMPIVGEKF